jgi:hypothetical protein
MNFSLHVSLYMAPIMRFCCEEVVVLYGFIIVLVYPLVPVYKTDINDRGDPPR